MEYLEMISAQRLVFSNPASRSVAPVTMSTYLDIELYSKIPTPPLILGLMKERRTKQADYSLQVVVRLQRVTNWARGGS